MSGNNGGAEPVENEVTQGQGRRRFMKKAAVGAGAAWVAPTVLSSRAWAQGTCVTQSWDWADAGYAGSGATPPYQAVLGGTTVDFTVSDPDGMINYTDVRADFGRGDIFRAQLNNVNAGGSVVLTFAFSLPVTDLAFTVYDVDASATPASPTTGWVDRIVVPSAVGTGGTSPPGPTESAGGTWTGTSSVLNGSSDADVAFAAAGPLTSVTVSYQRAGLTISQGIAIPNFTFCGAA